MNFYSVHISGGTGFEQAGREARETFGGRDADYTGCPNFFYVARKYGKETLRENVSGSLADKYEVTVEEITEDEYNWRSR